jgi:hypothetical protein
MGLILLAIALLTPWSTLDHGHIGIIMLCLIVVAMMMGFPSAFTLMGMGVLFSWIAYRSVESRTSPCSRPSTSQCSVLTA